MSSYWPMKYIIYRHTTLLTRPHCPTHGSNTANINVKNLPV